MGTIRIRLDIGQEGGYNRGMDDKTDTNKVELNQVSYEVDGKTLFTEALERVCERHKEAFEALGPE